MTRLPVTGQYVSAGDLDRTLQIISITNTLNSLGEPVQTETVVATMRAIRANFATSDYFRMQTTGTIADVQYQTRYKDGIVNGMIVREDTTDYYIIAVQEVGRRKGLCITCKAAS